MRPSRLRRARPDNSTRLRSFQKDIAPLTIVCKQLLTMSFFCLKTHVCSPMHLPVLVRVYPASHWFTPHSARSRFSLNMHAPSSDLQFAQSVRKQAEVEHENSYLTRKSHDQCFKHWILLSRFGTWFQNKSGKSSGYFFLDLRCNIHVPRSIFVESLGNTTVLTVTLEVQ